MVKLGRCKNGVDPGAKFLMFFPLSCLAVMFCFRRVATLVHYVVRWYTTRIHEISAISPDRLCGAIPSTPFPFRPKILR